MYSNRRGKNLQCLRGLSSQDLPAGTCIETVLVDDGSTDGTSQAVLGEFSEDCLISSNGSLYWCGGKPRFPTLISIYWPMTPTPTACGISIMATRRRAVASKSFKVRISSENVRGTRFRELGATDPCHAKSAGGSYRVPKGSPSRNG